MRTIEVDDAVYAFLQKNAIAYVEAPNDTVRRLLGLEFSTSVLPRQASTALTSSGRTKERKVDLYELKRLGLLKEGQRLFLHDYKKKRLAGHVAEVGPGINKLQWSGRRYSMSALASKLLQENGYAADSVRGPAHWYTEDGVSVLELWQKRRNGR